MNLRTFSLTAGVFFFLIALGHLLRVAFGVSFVVGSNSVPMWASGIAVIVTGYLAYAGFRLSRKLPPGA